MSAVLMVALSSMAAAQKTSAVTKKDKECAQKGFACCKKAQDANPDKKEEPAPVKLIIVTPVITETDIPVIKE